MRAFRPYLKSIYGEADIPDYVSLPVDITRTL